MKEEFFYCVKILTMMVREEYLLRILNRNWPHSHTWSTRDFVLDGPKASVENHEDRVIKFLFREPRPDTWSLFPSDLGGRLNTVSNGN
jgi:hypothetical protein